MAVAIDVRSFSWMHTAVFHFDIDSFVCYADLEGMGQGYARANARPVNLGTRVSANPPYPLTWPHKYPSGALYYVAIAGQHLSRTLLRILIPSQPFSPS